MGKSTDKREIVSFPNFLNFDSTNFFSLLFDEKENFNHKICEKSFVSAFSKLDS